MRAGEGGRGRTGEGGRERERAGADATRASWLGALPVLLALTGVAAAQQRPMSFLDVQQVRTVGGAAISPDGNRVLYTLSTPDWKEARRTTDIYLVSVDGGVGSTRQMTFTNAS